MATENKADAKSLERLRQAYTQMRREIAKVVVGQDRVIDELLIGIFARGHCLLVGVPGLAKTLLIRTLAQTMHLSFNRIQFTPDLMPSDITGTEVIQQNPQTGERVFRFIQGPVFANVILADEINRTPPKTQAALLEAMQEGQVTAAGKKHILDPPFFVLATQNPIEQEGTYPLPEAQLDRFMFHINVDYPTEEEELNVMKLTTVPQDAVVKAVLTGADIHSLQDLVRRVPVADHVIRYAMSLARVSRVSTGQAPKFVQDWVAWGAGPRATQYLILGGKARAVLNGRSYVSTEDIRAVARPVMRHRIITNFSAEAEGITSDHIVGKILEAVPVPEGEAVKHGRVAGVLGSQSPQ